MNTIIGLVILIGLGYLAYKIVAKVIRRLRGLSGRKTWPEIELEAAQQWLADLGPTHQQRMAAIAAMFEGGTATITSTSYLAWDRQEEAAEVQQRQTGNQRPARRTINVQMLLTVERNLAGLDNRERTYLRVAEELNSAANGAEHAFIAWRTGLVWGDGKGTWKGQWSGLRERDQDNPVGMAIEKLHMSVEVVLNAMQQYAASALAQPDLDPDRRAILSELTQAIAPGAGGNSWLKSAEINNEGSPFKPGKYPLHIGTMEDGTPLTYSGEGSIVTIAPPGSGKTECNVYPNLLTWCGPAVVLDISGEIYEKTAQWRRANVGPVFKFSPLEPDDSHKYNPLTFVRREPDYIWEDSRLLAEMMVVPSLSSDPFWENEARTVLTAAIAHVCYSNTEDNRPMHSVLDILFGGEAWNQMIVGLRMAVDVHVMTQHATALMEMNEKTRSSVLQTARSSLNAWAGERVARATAHSDWNPEDLRNGTNPTIYIYIRPNEVDAYLSVLRVFIGQHIRVLTGGQVPPQDGPPILFMLDELPRLRYMAPIDEALSIGRKYKLRLWMIAQSLGQFQTAYNNADGMLGSCRVRTFMNPGGADGLAERISEELGYVDSVSDNTRRRLVEAAALAGPAYEQLQIVFATGGKPAKVRKDWAYKDPEFKRRMELAPDGDGPRGPVEVADSVS